MKEQTRKKLCLTAAILFIGAGVVFSYLILKGYSQTVPIVIGPYRKAIFIVLGVLTAAAFGFYLRPFNAQTVTGALYIAFSVGWFTGKMLLNVRSPEAAFLSVMDHWMPFPLIVFGIGVALWAGALLPMQFRTFSRSEKWQLLLVLLLMFIILEPILQGGFYWDDAFFSVEAQAMRLSGELVFKRVWKEIVDYVRIGRINPFATFHFLVFYFIPDVRFYKLLLVVLTLLNGWLFYRFLHLWSKDHQSALLVLLIVPLCFQFRLYHDPLSSYYGLMQVMFLELLGAMIHYVHWLRERKKGDLILSLLFFSMGLMSYEMFFPLTALFLIPALAEEKNLWKAIRRMLPWVVLAVVIFGLSMMLRTNITEETAYNGTTFGLDIPAILKTFFIQVRAAIPLHYRTAGSDTGLFGNLIPWGEIFNTSLAVFIHSIHWQDLLACLILVTIMFRYPDNKMTFSGYGLLFGLLLWLLPGLVISLSSKYQNDLTPGLAYIPVYFSYFGMGLLLYECLALLGKVIQPRVMKLLISGAGCMILLIAMQDNRHISVMLDDIFLYPRNTGENALQAGILGETDGLTVISAAPFNLWEQGWLGEPYQAMFYSLNVRKEVNAIGAKDYVEQFREEQPVWTSPENVVLFGYRGNAHGGYAMKGRLRGTGFDFETNQLKNSIVSDVFVFVSGEYEKDMMLIYETRDGEWKRLPLEDEWLVNKTEEGTVYKIQEGIPILFDTVMLGLGNK